MRITPSQSKFFHKLPLQSSNLLTISNTRPHAIMSEFLPSFGTTRPSKGRQERRMASTSASVFHEKLMESKRVLALCGAGLSAASGLDTFRGNGGMWRNYQATTLATPEAFTKDPGLVWLFYALRRHQALQAKPNMAHFALAEFARKMSGEGFLCLSQNVDGLSQRADHPPEQLKLLHSNLFDLKCFNDECDHIERDNYDDPLCPALDTSDENIGARLAPAAKSLQSYLDPKEPKAMEEDELPHCPKCKTGLLRPGVVWFGESLPQDTLSSIDRWISRGPIDLILVIGTTATVYPAAGYVEIARRKGASVAVVNMDSGELGAASSLHAGDFYFEGDAATLLPQMLEPVIGDLEKFHKEAAPLKGENLGRGAKRPNAPTERLEREQVEVEEEVNKDEVQKYFDSLP